MRVSEELRQSVLHAAMQGKLTKQLESDSNVENTLDEIKKVKRRFISQYKIREKEILQISENEIEFDYLKKGWKMVRLGNLCPIMFMGKSPKYSKQENSYLCIGQKNNQDYGFDDQGIKFVDQNFWNTTPDYQFLNQNDVLLNTLGTGTVGRVGLFTYERKALTDGHIIVMRFLNQYTARYVRYILKLRRNDIEESANGSTNQKFINLNDVKNYLIPLPPIEEQQRIVEKLDKLLPLCSGLHEY